ncbi:MAG: hypothetical protein ACOY9Y_10680 [Bacillota bacterium]
MIGDMLSLNRLLCQVEGIDYNKATCNPARVVAGKSYAGLLDYEITDLDHYCEYLGSGVMQLVEINRK